MKVNLKGFYFNAAIICMNVLLVKVLMVKILEKLRQTN